jgi:hypothetical protein
MRSDTLPEYVQTLVRTPAGEVRSTAVAVWPGNGAPARGLLL